MLPVPPDTGADPRVRVTLATPTLFAASETETPSAARTSSRRMAPGCTGLFMLSTLLRGSPESPRVPHHHQGKARRLPSCRSPTLTSHQRACRTTGGSGSPVFRDPAAPQGCPERTGSVGAWAACTPLIESRAYSAYRHLRRMLTITTALYCDTIQGLADGEDSCWKNTGTGMTASQVGGSNSPGAH